MAALELQVPAAVGSDAESLGKNSQAVEKNYSPPEKVHAFMRDNQVFTVTWSISILPLMSPLV